MMEMAWCAETATKAYIDTVKTSELLDESSVAEVLSAMAGGSKAQLIVETWTRGGGVTTSVALAIARNHTCGRHVCVVPDQRSRSEYMDEMRRVGFAPEVVVGEAEEVMGGFSGADFVVVDCRRKDFVRVLRFAKLSPRGAVLVCKNFASRTAPVFRWRGVLGSSTTVVRSACLPIGTGLEIAQVVLGGGLNSPRSRWIRQIDRHTGEEHVFRR